MEPEDAFDAVHLKAAQEVDAFREALTEAEGEAAADKAADMAYLFVEYLANTFPKPPREATERDLCVFLFEYAIAEGPFSGPTLEAAPRSLALFVDWLARRERVREAAFLRAACADEEFFVKRLAGYRAIAASRDDQRAADAVDRWWAELDERLRLRGLSPDASLVGGSEEWGDAMGPVEAAVFDALCLLTAAKARELRARRIDGAQALPELKRIQRAFMMAPNRGLGDTPFAAILKERERAR